MDRIVIFIDGVVVHIHELEEGSTAIRRNSHNFLRHSFSKRKKGDIVYLVGVRCVFDNFVNDSEAYLISIEEMRNRKINLILNDN